jgi:hypothetical protein
MKAECAPSASIAPQQQQQQQQQQQRIWIGSNGGSGPITVTSELCQLSCPTIVKSDNWLTNDNYNDRFRISTAEISNESGSWTSVSAVRDDVANAGWGMNLGFECTGVVCPA